MSGSLQAPLVRQDKLSSLLGLELFAQRDDLLPFPLAGNKVRKLVAELEALDETPDLLITNGGVDSNHCRTMAVMAAERGLRAHLVLHGDPSEGGSSPTIRLLNQLGCSADIVRPDGIRDAIDAQVARARARGLRVHVVPGGCHSPAGALAYATAGRQVLESLEPDFLIVASGTGATHGGLAAAAVGLGNKTHVIGISVARNRERGVPPVAEAAAWAGANGIPVYLDDAFRAGGYGVADARTREAVRIGWAHGLPLDHTYTGKAFAALLSYARTGKARGRVLFWHTGGLWNSLVECFRSET